MNSNTVSSLTVLADDQNVMKKTWYFIGNFANLQNNSGNSEENKFFCKVWKVKFFLYIRTVFIVYAEEFVRALTARD